MDESKAQYIAMRAFGEPDAFPSKDLVLRRKLSGKKPLLSSEQTLTIAEGWRPWRAYAAMNIAG
jgi:AraC family transcriptional regulator of adaptative response / DNA-3-methyladenine glycosylase II